MERPREVRVGDTLSVAGRDYVVRAVIAEEDALVLASEPGGEVSHILWAPTIEWDDSLDGWRVTQHKGLQEQG